MKPIRFQPIYIWRTIMMIGSILLLFVPGLAFFFTPNLSVFPQTFTLFVIVTVAVLVQGFFVSRKFPLLPGEEKTKDLPDIVQFAVEEARRQQVSLVCVSFSKHEPTRRLWGTLYLPEDVLTHLDIEEAKGLVVFCMHRREGLNLFVLAGICVTYFFLVAVMFAIPLVSNSLKPLVPVFIPTVSLLGMPIMMELSRRDCVNAVAATVDRFGDVALVEKALNLAKRPVSPWELYKRHYDKGQAAS